MMIDDYTIDEDGELFGLDGVAAVKDLHTTI